MFDCTALHETIAATFCDTPAIWNDNTVLVAIEPQSNKRDAEFALANTEIVVAGCLTNAIAGIGRKDTVQINGQSFQVLQVIDEKGWTTLVLEKS